MAWGRSLVAAHPRALDGFDGAAAPGPAHRRDTMRSAPSRPVSDRRPAVEVAPSSAAVDELLRCYLEAGEEDDAPPDTDRMLDMYEQGREDVDGYLREVRRG